MTTYQAVQVTWNDAKSHGGGWQTIEDTIKNARGPFEVSSVGYLLKRNKKELILAQTLTKNGLAADTITIPSGFVHKVRRLSGK